ncbi:hypothetical protein BDZ85DRAFT_254445 [Elsinoe ampelina]|uniref:Uncharacterized protein n=1 Tax=Elsinoe ampelina TaxID=302913 RepID=A0A6A6GP53_9PEZI|nr:hypothetical protein BDZ85DRAFT_254445 [Elsinoe ampelina]
MMAMSEDIWSTPGSDGQNRATEDVWLPPLVRDDCGSRQPSCWQAWSPPRGRVSASTPGSMRISSPPTLVVSKLKKRKARVHNTTRNPVGAASIPAVLSRAWRARGPLSTHHAKNILLASRGGQSECPIYHGQAVFSRSTRRSAAFQADRSTSQWSAPRNVTWTPDARDSPSQQSSTEWAGESHARNESARNDAQTTGQALSDSLPNVLITGSGEVDPAHRCQADKSYHNTPPTEVQTHRKDISEARKNFKSRPVAPSTGKTTQEMDHLPATSSPTHQQTRPAIDRLSLVPVGQKLSDCISDTQENTHRKPLIDPTELRAFAHLLVTQIQQALQSSSGQSILALLTSLDVGLFRIAGSDMICPRIPTCLNSQNAGRTERQELQHYCMEKKAPLEDALQWAMSLLLVELAVYAPSGPQGVRLFRQRWYSAVKDHRDDDKKVRFERAMFMANSVAGKGADEQILAMVHSIAACSTLQAGLEKSLALSENVAIRWGGARVITFELVHRRHTYADDVKLGVEHILGGAVNWWPLADPPRLPEPFVMQLQWKRGSKTLSLDLPRSQGESIREAFQPLVDAIKTAEILDHDRWDLRQDGVSMDSDDGRPNVVPQAALVPTSTASSNGSAIDPDLVSRPVLLVRGAEAPNRPEDSGTTRVRSQQTAQQIENNGSTQQFATRRRGRIYWCVGTSMGRQISIQRVDIATHGLDDSALFRRLKKEYVNVKGQVKSLLSLKSLSNVEFIMFGSSDRLPHEAIPIKRELPCPCRPSCDHKYEFSQCGSGDTHQILAARDIMDGLSHPDRTHNAVRTLSEIPQDLAQTKFGRGVLGWGILAIETMDVWKCSVVVVLTIIIGIVFAALWLALVDGNDVQSAVTVAVLLVALLNLGFTMPQCLTAMAKR